MLRAKNSIINTSFIIRNIKRQSYLKNLVSKMVPPQKGQIEFIARGMKSNSGFIAILSITIISLVLTLLVFSLSFTGFYVRSNILNSEAKAKSESLTEACIQTALLKLANNISYLGNETIAVDSDSCLIRNMQTVGSEKIIESQAQYQNTFINYQVHANTADLTITQWTELAHF